MFVIIQHPDGREYEVEEAFFRDEYQNQGFTIAFYRDPATGGFTTPEAPPRAAPVSFSFPPEEN